MVVTSVKKTSPTSKHTPTSSVLQCKTGNVNWKMEAGRDVYTVFMMKTNLMNLLDVVIQ